MLYLHPVIACLTNLECLDLSFNKMRNLPDEIIHLNSLLSLNVADNKSIEVPPSLSSLQRLVNLDFSNNRLKSLENLDLLSMCNLHKLNLQICPRMTSPVPSSEMDVLEGYYQEENSENSQNVPFPGSLVWKGSTFEKSDVLIINCVGASIVLLKEEDHCVERSSCVASDSFETCIDIQNCKKCDALVGSLSDAADLVEGSSSSEVSNNPPKSKRQLDGVIDIPKPCKIRRPTDHSEVSCKHSMMSFCVINDYSMMSFCVINDYLPDGFYDTG
ncbi:hypothetical protein T459_12136 [Capsicum annuum]|uniref:Uncharacterized protein n=1 Tax=Capsicum annuum TaxID=4072 RepID=A0A2G2ZNZ1_CAPAN|nr:hypothetical protein T459_12136 [Capsicum annuum]